MPPNCWWRGIWLATELPSIQRPSRTTAAAVSSQELSIASTRTTFSQSGLIDLYQENRLWCEQPKLASAWIDVQADPIPDRLGWECELPDVGSAGRELDDPRLSGFEHPDVIEPLLREHI